MNLAKPPANLPDTPEERRRWSRRPESRPAEILAAAFTVFSQYGYVGSTIADVGKQAGVSPALVMHYFGTKADLFEAVLYDRFGPLMASEEALLASHRGTYRELLHQLIRRLWEYVWEPGNIELAIAVKAARDDFPQGTRTVSQLGGRWRGLIEGVLEAGRKQGEFRTSGPHVARVIAATVMGAVEAHRCFGRVEHHPSNPDELWAALVDFLDHGVLAAQADSQ